MPVCHIHVFRAAPWIIVAGLSSAGVQAAPVVRSGTGATPAALQAVVDSFRADLGGANNGVGGTFPDGRREVNWDGVPDAFAAPNFLPPNFFNTNSPRGIVFHSLIEDAGSAYNRLIVSASAASGTPVRFGDINPGYSSTFITFTAQRMFVARGAHALQVQFFQPGTTNRAVVKGFGVVFSDVDVASHAIVFAYAPDGSQLAAASAPALSGGLSFVGLSFDAGEKIDHVVIRAGTHALSASNNDGGSVDVIAMDDVIYGEPRPASGCLFADGFDCQMP